MNQRIIKFRAWNEDKKEIFYPSSISWKGGVVWVCNAKGENELEYELVVPDVALMQFTGLKDKNGKEIWEGDVIYRNTWKMPLDENHKADYCVVEFQRDGFVGRPFHQKHGTALYFFFGGNPMPYEVIGNVHENPELMT